VGVKRKGKKRKTTEPVLEEKKGYPVKQRTPALGLHREESN